MLFEPPHEELSDEEIAAVLRQSIEAAGRLSRQAHFFLASVCAEHLIEGLRAAGLMVIRTGAGSDTTSAVLPHAFLAAGAVSSAGSAR